MKLREYLEQFKDLDPELEVYKEHSTVRFVAFPCVQNVKIAFMKDNDSCYRNFKSFDFDNEVLVLY